MLGDDIDQPVTIVKHAFFVSHDYAITVSIKRNANISLMQPDRFLQGGTMRRAAFKIDIETVGLRTDGNNIRAQLMQHGASNLICRTMSTVNYDAQTTQIEMIGKGAFAEFDVTPSGVIDPARFPELR
jgi:hypothetical protein